MSLLDRIRAHRCGRCRRILGQLNYYIGGQYICWRCFRNGKNFPAS